MRTSTSTHLERVTDPAEAREDPYKGNKQARLLGLRARQHELAAKIWDTYLKAKGCEAVESTEEQSDWTREDDSEEVPPAGDPNPVRGSMKFSSLDMMLVVPKDKWKEVGIRAEDVDMLDRMANGVLSDEECMLYVRQIYFLEGVLGILYELSSNNHTLETCKGIAAVFREEARKVSTPETEEGTAK